MSTHKPQVRIIVEVTEELVMNGRKQVCYVHLGGAYPERDELWCPDDGPFKPGHYAATEVYYSNEKYPRLLVSMGRLTPVKNDKAA